MSAAVALAEVGSADGLAVRAARVAAIASQYADAVDVEGRFPREAVDAMRAEKLLSIQIPAEFGGEGASITEIAELCSILGQTCAASAMVFAMHHIKLSSLVEHGAGSDWHRDFMRRIAREQLLLASATTEGGIGGAWKRATGLAKAALSIARLYLIPAKANDLPSTIRLQPAW